MKIVFGNSRWRTVISFFGSLVLFVAGILVIVIAYSDRNKSSHDATVGWLCTLLFGACAAFHGWRFFDSRPRLVIDDEGIYDRTLGLIPWSDIQGAYLRSIHSNDFICLDVRDSDRYLQRMSDVKRALASANAALGFTPISLSLSGIVADSNDILELIVKRMQKPTENA